MARRITGHAQDAEDVAQEAFLRLYRSLDQLDPERPVEPWLVRITVNAARNHLARSPARREDGLDRAAPQQAPDDDPSRDLEAADLRRALEEAVGELTEREREVFLLRDLEGLAVPLIAEALGIAEVTVRRMSGKARLRVVAWVRRHRPELARHLGAGGPEKNPGAE